MPVITKHIDEIDAGVIDLKKGEPVTEFKKLEAKREKARKAEERAAAKEAQSE